MLRRADETVAPPGDRLDVAGRFGRVAHRFPQPLDDIVQPVFEVHESVRWPDPLLKFRPGEDFSRPFQQRLQYLEGLLWEFQLDAVLAQLSALQIHFETVEADDPFQRTHFRRRQ